MSELNVNEQGLTGEGIQDLAPETVPTPETQETETTAAPQGEAKEMTVEELYAQEEERKRLEAIKQKDEELSKEFAQPKEEEPKGDEPKEVKEPETKENDLDFDSALKQVREHTDAEINRIKATEAEERLKIENAMAAKERLFESERETYQNEIRQLNEKLVGMQTTRVDATDDYVSTFNHLRKSYTQNKEDPKTVSQLSDFHLRNLSIYEGVSSTELKDALAIVKNKKSGNVQAMAGGYDSTGGGYKVQPRAPRKNGNDLNPDLF